MGDSFVKMLATAPRYGGRGIANAPRLLTYTL
nr:MAG TPA: hypothetical protein [Caudoviricetes sp.]